MQKLYILFLFIAMYVSASSAEILSPYIQLSTNSLTFEANTYNTKVNFELNSNTGWIISTDNNKIYPIPNFGVNSQTITINPYTNNSAAPNLATLTIRDSANILTPQYIKVYQKGSDEYIRLTRNSLTLTKLDKSSASISIITNTSWTYKNVPNWISINKGNSNNSSENLTLEFIATKLPDNNSRTANIEIVGQFGASQTVTITQVNEEPYVKFHTNYMKIPAKLPDGSFYIGIKSNTHWNISTDAKLPISYFYGSGVYNNTVGIGMYSENGPVARTATFTATAKGAPTQYLVVEQEAAEPYLNFSVDTLFFTNIPNSSNTISILSNTSWTMTNMPKWLHTKITSGSYNNYQVAFYVDKDPLIEEGKIDFITNTALIKTLIVKKLDELPKIQTSVSSVTVSSKRYANQDYQLKISANNSFNIRNSSDWAFASRSSYNQNIYYLTDKDTIFLRINENYSSSPRSATISGEKDGVLYPFIEIYQEGNPAFIIFSSTIALEKEANSSKVFDITSNSSWTITNLPNWLSVNKTSDYNIDGGRIYSLTFTTENKLNTTYRTGTFEILSGSLPSKTITVIQLAEEPYLQISTTSMTISDKPNVKYSIDIKSNTNWFIDAKKIILQSDFENLNIYDNNYYHWIGFGDNSFTFTSNRNWGSIDIVSNLKFVFLHKDTIKTFIVELTQLKSSEFIDLEVVEISSPFDLSDTTELLNKRYNCSVKFKNNSTVPVEHIPISLDIVDCFTGKVDITLNAVLTFIDSGSSNTEIVKFGNFSLIRAGNYYARATVRNLNDKTFSNNTLKSKCKYFDNPEVTKVEDAPLGDFRIYPNPNNGYFNISGYEAIDYLRIVDLLGNTIYEQEKPSNSIALNNINAGVYWVLVTSNGISKMEKLVIY